MNNKFTLVHIGKCGGGSVIKELLKHKIKYDYLHVQPVHYQPNTKYIIMIRNPISRFISAFNWRYHLLSTGIQNNKKELDGLRFYKNVNNLAESLYKNGELNPDADAFINQIYAYNHPELVGVSNLHPSHLGMNIHWYIGDLLNKCKPEDIIGVITTENLKGDMKRLFNITLSCHQNKNKRNTPLSDTGYANLKKYLHKDYECISKLYEFGLLTDKVYKLVSV